MSPKVECVKNPSRFTHLPNYGPFPISMFQIMKQMMDV